MIAGVAEKIRRTMIATMTTAQRNPIKARILKNQNSRRSEGF
jgi:hypothetical protein